MPKVLLVEDEFIIAKDIKLFLEKENNYSVVVARNYQQAELYFSTEKIDLIICDVNLNEEKDGIDFISTIVSKNPKPVIYLTAYNDASIVSRAKKTVPFAYLLKPFNEIQLNITIELALLNFNAAKNKIDKCKESTKKIETLTKREKEILIVLASGKTSKEVGEVLSISKLTVEKHKKNIKDKLGLNTLGELINFTLSSRLYKAS